MSWFNNLFSNNNNVDNNNAIMADTNMANFDIMEDVFIDNNQPAEPTAVEENTTNNIMAFLSQDFFTRGYEDGYRSHSDEMLQNTLKGIKADFRSEIDILVNQKRKERLDVLNLQVDTGKISESLNQQSENILADFDQSLKILHKEKENSAMDEGWVMKAIHKYHEGFVKGTSRYQEEKLLAISTGMFN